MPPVIHEMKVYYDNEIDALYLSLGDQEPDGVIEFAEGVNLDTTADGKIAGIEILKASYRALLRLVWARVLTRLIYAEAFVAAWSLNGEAGRWVSLPATR